MQIPRGIYFSGGSFSILFWIYLTRNNCGWQDILLLQNGGTLTDFFALSINTNNSMLFSTNLRFTYGSSMKSLSSTYNSLESLWSYQNFMGYTNQANLIFNTNLGNSQGLYVRHSFSQPPFFSQWKHLKRPGLTCDLGISQLASPQDFTVICCKKNWASTIGFFC